MPGSTVTAPPADPVANAAERRGVAFAARHLLWDRHDQLPQGQQLRVRTCGRVNRLPEGEPVKVRVTTAADGSRSAGWSGVASCGSVWACPVCSRKIAAKRQVELCEALTVAVRRGWRIGLVTLTMRHHKGHRLKALFRAVSKGWAAATSGRRWVADQERYGIAWTRMQTRGLLAGVEVTTKRIPFVRVIETTHGAKGWHVHVHALLFLPSTTTDADVKAIGRSMFDRWSAAIVRAGFAAPEGEAIWDSRRGQYVTPGWKADRLEGDPQEAFSEYFTKAVFSASMETARGDLKDAKFGNRTPFGILRGLIETKLTGELGDWATADDEDIWGEWERASKGVRQFTWAEGIRDELAMAPEATDQELAEEDEGGESVAEVPVDTFLAITKARADFSVLRAFETSDEAGWAMVREYWTGVDQRRLERARGRLSRRQR